MLSFFRRALSTWVVVGLLALLMVAFVVTGVGTPNGLGMGQGTGTGEPVAKIGGEAVRSSELARRAQSELKAARADSPRNQSLDMAAFVAGGGVEQTLQQYIAGRAMELWARRQGMGASDKLVDGEIGSISAFNGPAGKFDRATFDGVLAREHIKERDLRADIAGDLIRRQLLVPITGATKVPASLVTPYASLLLEARHGSIGIVPAAAMPAAAAPSDADVAAFYARNVPRYTVPERRVIRYALIGPEQVATSTKPSDAEVAAYYQANADKYAAKDTRSFSQVILSDEAAAKAFVAGVRGGTAFAAAAAKQGFAAADIAIGDQTRDALAKLASPAVAAAAFAAPQGGITDPVKSSLGWHVVRVDAVKTIPGRSLAQARGEIAAALEKQKADDALGKLVATMDDKLSGGSTFDDVAKSANLAVVTTPPVTADGRAPDQPGFQPAPELRPLLKQAFEAGANEAPTVETVAPQHYALLAVSQVVAAAPAPLAKARGQVAADLAAERAAARAQAVATALVAKIKAGAPIAKAFAEAGMRLPPVQPAGGRQIDIQRSGSPPPPPLALMFSMNQGDTKMLAAPGGQGWFVVHLDTTEQGDATKTPGLIDATRGQFVEVLGREYAEQFSTAVAKELGTSRDAGAIARLKAQLAGGTAGQ